MKLGSSALPSAKKEYIPAPKSAMIRNRVTAFSLTASADRLNDVGEGDECDEGDEVDESNEVNELNDDIILSLLRRVLLLLRCRCCRQLQFALFHFHAADERPEKQTFHRALDRLQ